MDTCMKYLPWICVMFALTYAQPGDFSNLEGRTATGQEIRGGQNGFPVHGGACPGERCANGLRGGQGASAPPGSPPLLDDTPPFRGGLTRDVFQQDQGANGFQTVDQRGGHIFTDRQERPRVHRPSIRTHHPSVPTHHTPTRTHHIPTRTHHTPVRTHHSLTHTGISTGSHVPRVVSHGSDPGVHIGLSQLPAHHNLHGRHRTRSHYPSRRVHHVTGGHRVTGGHLVTGGHHVPRRTHIVRSHIPVTSHGRVAVGNPLGHLINTVLGSIVDGSTGRHHRGGRRHGGRRSGGRRTSGGY